MHPAFRPAPQAPSNSPKGENLERNFSSTKSIFPFFRPALLHMQIDKRRHISSYILLAVIVPMMLMSWLHVHDEDAHSESVDCIDCLHHVHHSHVSPHDAELGTCLLCQFLTIEYTPSPSLVFNWITCQEGNVWQQLYVSVVAPAIQLNSLRGPPSVCLV